ncbi:MAG: hypothetical protein HW389_3780 [Bacteroidetes bacterium]|nr:hypothetical protein [Bacteroidota bacterium]
MNLIDRRDALRLISAWVILITHDLRGQGVTELELKSYTFTRREIVFKGSPVYKIKQGGIDDDFMGPILFGGRVLVVASVRDLLLVFDEKGRLFKEIKIPVQKPRMFYPARPMINVIVNLGPGILLYSSDGWAFHVSESFRVKRMKSLDIEAHRDRYVGPRTMSHYAPYTNSVLRIPCWGKPPYDAVAVNLKKMKVEDPTNAR